MKIKLSPAELEKTYKLLDTKEINMSIADLLFQTFEETSFFIGSNTADSFYHRLLKFWDISKDKTDDIKILEKWVKHSIFPLKADYFSINPYYNTVKPIPVKEGKYELNYLSYKPYQPFSLDDITVDEKDYYLERSPLGYFTKENPYLVLSYDNEVWMCITPNEINTMEPSIKQAKGDVLVLGLGLGYYPFMISLKEEVKDITIIELDEKIIDIFNKHLLPLFPHKEKIHIIKGDGINYLKNNQKHFDTVFMDLWHNPEDGLPLYIQLKRLENDNSTIYQYWLEKSLIALYRRCLLTVYEESLQGYKDKDYQTSSNEIEKIINSIYFKTKNITINAYDDIYKLLSDDSIIKLIIS